MIPFLWTETTIAVQFDINEVIMIVSRIIPEINFTESNRHECCNTKRQSSHEDVLGMTFSQVQQSVRTATVKRHQYFSVGGKDTWWTQNLPEEHVVLLALPLK